MVSVDIYVADDSVSPQPIVGATLNVYDGNGVLQASGTTDSTGKASFMLAGAASPNGVTYEVRIFKLGVIFPNPTLIHVFDPVPGGTTNKFDIAGTLLTIPASVDPRTCQCTGRFVNYSNQPIAGVTVRIMAKAQVGLQEPKIVDGNLVSAQVMALQTDHDGFLSVPLLRGGRYYVMFAGEDETIWNILVPDRASANLIDLLFPAPVTITWDQTVAPSNVISVAIGHTVLVPYVITFSDFETNPDSLKAWVQFIASDTTKINFDGLSIVGTLAVTGLVAGTSTVTVAPANDLAPVRVPTYAISGPALAVTVTP